MMRNLVTRPDMISSIAKPLSYSAPATGEAVMRLNAPATGEVLRLDELPHPLLQAGLLGTGAAINMTTGEVSAPLAAEVHSINIAKAQLILVHAKGLKLQLQIGLPGEICYGERLRWLVKKGQRCEAGTPLLQSDPLWIKQQDALPVCVLTLLNAGRLGAIVLTSDPKIRINDEDFLALYA